MKKHEHLPALRKFGLVPTFNEVFLFIAAITIVTLSIISNTFRVDLVEVFVKIAEFDSFDGGRLLVLSMFTVGFMGAIYYAWSPKTPKKAGGFLLFFITVLNLIVAYFAFGYALSEVGTSWQILFPIINLIGAAMLIAIYLGKGGELMIDTRNAKRHETIIGTLIAISIILIGNYVLKIHWSIIFSIILSYAELTNQWVTQRLFP